MADAVIEAKSTALKHLRIRHRGARVHCIGLPAERWGQRESERQAVSTDIARPRAPVSIAEIVARGRSAQRTPPASSRATADTAAPVRQSPLSSRAVPDQPPLALLCYYR